MELMLLFDCSLLQHAFKQLKITMLTFIFILAFATVFRRIAQCSLMCWLALSIEASGPMEPAQMRLIASSSMKSSMRVSALFFTQVHSYNRLHYPALGACLRS
jgi:hypothetical protein